MKTSNQRVQSIKNKVTAKRKRRALLWAASATACLLLVLTVICSLPILGGGVPNVNAYKNDSYFPIIQKINSAYRDERYSVFDRLGNYMVKNDDLSTSLPPSAPDLAAPDDQSSTSKYEETTLNQVDGVIEADILKRSTTHAFYLRNHYSQNAEPCLAVDVYAPDGQNTQKVASHVIKPLDETSFSQHSTYIDGEMFLNDDATRLTVITNCVNKNKITYTVVVSLDVTNVQQITEVKRVYVSGEYTSSRKVDGQLLIVTNFKTANYRQIDYGNKQTYIPLCGDLTDDSLLSMDNIYVPENCQRFNYTVLALLDEETLDVKSQYATFAYSFDVYVSRDYVFVIRNVNYGYGDKFEYGKEVTEYNSVKMYASVVEIVVLRYRDGLKYVGCVGLEGSVKDRYSLDENDGVLRVFTTVRRDYVRVSQDIGFDPFVSSNASLYCVDISSMKTVAGVERFAPPEDEVKSARFDGDKAYVCTAVRQTDPVFFFDLSDVNNITYIDTGTIPGFSVSLIKFKDKLLGIGQGEDRASLKVELYDEIAGKVVSVSKFERFCSFSYDYKAHFINEEHGLIGLQIYDCEDGLVSSSPNMPRDKYLLLHYNADTDALEIVFLGEFDCSADLARAFYKDGGVYVFGSNGCIFIEN